MVNLKGACLATSLDLLLPRLLAAIRLGDLVISSPRNTHIASTLTPHNYRKLLTQTRALFTNRKRANRQGRMTVVLLPKKVYYAGRVVLGTSVVVKAQRGTGVASAGLTLWPRHSMMGPRPRLIT
ncbi:unnamed protein product, partial [Iphiclides podalirius]